MREGRTDLEWEQRFTELYRTPARARDVVLRVVGFAGPLTIVFALLAAVAEGGERRLVLGTYLFSITVVLLALWAIEPFITRSRARRKEGRRLAEELRDVSGSSTPSSNPSRSIDDDERSDMRYPVVSQRTLLFRLEYDQMRRTGISVMALWPFTARFLDENERSRIEGLGARRGANLAAAAGGLLAGLAGCIAATAGALDRAQLGQVEVLGDGVERDRNELVVYSLLLLLAGLLFLVGGMARAVRNAVELYRVKVEMIWSHATRIVATVETSLTGGSSVDRLHSLTTQVLDGVVILPTPSGQVIAASEVATTVKRTVQDALAPEAAINVMGALTALVTSGGAITVKLTTGVDAWSIAQREEDDVSSFRVRDGRDEPEMPYEFVVGPGVVSAARTPLIGVIPVEGGTVIVELRPDPTIPDEVDAVSEVSELPWISLYSMSRFVHAVQVKTSASSTTDE